MQFYRKVIDGVVQKERVQYGRPYGNVSYGKNATDEDYARNNFYPEVETKPETQEGKKIVVDSEVFADGKVVVTYKAVDKTTEELTAEWEQTMALSDIEDLPRWFEDHIEFDHGGTSDSPDLQARYDSKKLKRTNKPS